MWQRIDLAGLYGRAARRVLTATDEAGPPRPLPDLCPFGLDGLLAGDVAELLAGP